MSHPWMQQQSANVCLQPVWSEQASNGHIDADVLAQLEKLGFPEDYVVKCLQMNKHNHATTTYCLLLEKKRRMVDKLSAAPPGTARPPGRKPRLRCPLSRCLFLEQIDRRQPARR